MKKAIVFGAGGFIGSHMVNRLKSEGYWVHGVDLKTPEFSKTKADKFTIGDLTYKELVTKVIEYDMDELYQFAADMGGAGYIHTGDNDANVMRNSGLINLNTVEECRRKRVKKIFYSSSACVYNQLDCSEENAYPANPDSEYGWEKIFSERLYKAYNRNYGLNVRIARYHNIFGPEGSWNDGKEKAPAAMCRKAILSDDEMEVWGDGQQTRSFLYIDDCIEATRRLMNSDFIGPVNIGSEEMISINDFAQMAIKISGKNINIKNIDGPLGVEGRNSNNDLLEQKLGWKPTSKLIEGMKETFKWIKKQCEVME